MKEYTVSFESIEGMSSNTGYAGSVFVEAKTRNEAKAKVLEDFSGTFTDVEIDEVEAFDPLDDSGEGGKTWNVYVNAKGQNLEYERMIVMIQSETAEEAANIAREDFSEPFDVTNAEIEVEEE